MNKMNKNKNIKSSQKKENVNVRRVRQLDETNTNKNNKKEKPSVVSRTARMTEFNQYNNNNFATNVITLGGELDRVPEWVTKCITDCIKYGYGIDYCKDESYCIPSKNATSCYGKCMFKCRLNSWEECDKSCYKECLSSILK